MWAGSLVDEPLPLSNSLASDDSTAVLGQLLTVDGEQLVRRHWPAKETVAAVGIVHGLGEHSGRYESLAAQLNEHGIDVVTFDQRGHGRSPGKPGALPSYDRVLDDVGSLADSLATLAPRNRCFLLGQSLGANLVLNYALRRKPELGGLVALSPMLRMTTPPPAWKRLAVRVAARVVPNVTIPTGLSRANLSRITENVDAYGADPLVHSRISLGFAESMFDAGVWAIDNADQLILPTLLMHGDEDRTTCVNASRQFAERAADPCQLRIFSGAYHELLWELESQKAIDEISRWLREPQE